MIVFSVRMFYNYTIKRRGFVQNIRYFSEKLPIDIVEMNKTQKQEEIAMIQIIAGEKGKGKTKFLLEKVNNAVKDASGSIVYLDKSSKHMFELNNKVRLINVSDFPISNCDEFLGFLCGVVSQDHDLETMYLDSFLTIAAMKDDEISHAIQKLDIISNTFHVDFVLSVSKNEADLPECAKGKIAISL